MNSEGNGRDHRRARTLAVVGLVALVLVSATAGTVGATNATVLSTGTGVTPGPTTLDGQGHALDSERAVDSGVMVDSVAVDGRSPVAEASTGNSRGETQRSVSTAAGDVTFDTGIYTEQRGDVAEIGLVLTGTDTATVTIRDSGYWVQNVTVEDGNGDGFVTLEFNTYTAGTSDDTYGNGTGYVVYSVADGNDSVVNVSRAGGSFDPADPATGTLAARDYDLSVFLGNTTDTETDVATLVLEERNTTALTNYVVPDARIPAVDSVGNVSALVASGNVTEASTVAGGDGLVAKVDATGLEGVLKNHTDASYANDTAAFFAESASAPGGGATHAWDFGVVQTNPGPNASAYRATLNVSNTRLVADPDNETYWLVVDTDRVPEFTDGDDLETNVTTLAADGLDDGDTTVLDAWTSPRRRHRSTPTRTPTTTVSSTMSPS